MNTLDEITKHLKLQLQKAVENTQRELATIRSGKATTSLLDTVRVESYGQQMPLNQVASVSTPEPRLLTVQPWDKSLMGAVEKAIRASDLGLNPANDGEIIRVPLPPLTEERRKDMIKVVRHEAENGRIAIRNIRRDAIGHLKDLLKEKEISEDEEHRAHDEVQKLTDNFIAKVDELLAEKEEELLEF